MITLYELHWSHYCEKIRLALNFTGLPWRAVGIDAFRKSELRQQERPGHLPNHTVPAIHDDRTGARVMDSTPILRYLADTYPEAARLFPGGAAGRAAVDAKLLELDSRLGLPARRFGYTQVILECPGLLPELFLPHRANGLFTWPLLRRLAGDFLGMLLTKRFNFHRSEELGLYEALDEYLSSLARELESREFVVGESFSAADLALAAYLRPLTIVPYFVEHPALAGLFNRHRDIVARWSGEGDSAYQLAIARARQHRPPVRRGLRHRRANLPFAPRHGFAQNDQLPIWTWGMLAMPFHYLFTLRRNKFRQALADGRAR
jgi:glutathione S-transferase